MVSPNNDNNRGNNKRREKDPKEHGATPDNALDVNGLPELGEIVGEGSYAVAKLNESGETEKIVSAGTVKLHEHGISGEEKLGEVMLLAMGVKTTDDAHRALQGDNGRPDSSSLTMGYNQKYGEGWLKIWGSSN